MAKYLITEEGFFRGSRANVGDIVDWDPEQEGDPPYYYELMENVESLEATEGEEPPAEVEDKPEPAADTSVTDRLKQVLDALNELDHSNKKHFNESRRPKVAVVSKFLMDAGFDPTTSAEIQSIAPEFERDSRY